LAAGWDFGTMQPAELLQIGRHLAEQILQDGRSQLVGFRTRSDQSGIALHARNPDVRRSLPPEFQQ
jgi:hypothetical protein